MRGAVGAGARGAVRGRVRLPRRAGRRRRPEDPVAGSRKRARGGRARALAGRRRGRLLARDDERHALLLERCRPGTPLGARQRSTSHRSAAAPVEAGRCAVPVACGRGRMVGRVPAAVSGSGAGRPFEERLVDAAISSWRTLPATQGEQVLLNQDLHADNILAAEREPWLVIDPKPLVGEREFGVAAIVRGGRARPQEGGHHRAARPADRGAGARIGSARGAGRSGRRSHGAFDGDVHAGHAEIARWLLEAAA